jgi:hypothetical protein
MLFNSSSMKKIIIILLFIGFRFACVGQTITTIAGGGTSTSDGVPATTARTDLPFAGVFDKLGNYYFACAQYAIKK